MSKILYLDSDLFLNEGATRRCYHHPETEKKCLKITKESESINVHDLKSYHAVKATLGRYIAPYDNELIETNMGKALVCELIRDDGGKPSQSFAEYRRSQKINQLLIDQFLDFFDLLQKNDLFFYDFNPKNFMIQQTAKGERLKYTDLKSLGKTKATIALEKIPCFARMKLKRRTSRFMKKHLM